MEGSTNGPEDQVSAGTVSTTPWTPLSAYEPKNIDWLWKPRFIANRINTIAGLGDVGKDVFCCAIAAVATGGVKTWPDGAPGPAEPMKVGVICPEDEAEDTIRPRMEAAGANVDLVRVWPKTRRALPSELKTLGLLIVSPLIDLMDGRKDINREQDVRAFFKDWKEAGCTVIGTAHYGKASDRAAQQRVLGASGIVNYIRSNWAIQRDDEDKDLRLFMRLKANLTPDDADGLAFRIKHVGPYDQSIRCEWEGTTDKTPDEVLQASPGGKKTTAGQWLERSLMGQPGWVAEYRDIIEAGKAAGYGEDALKKAKNRSKNIESSAGTGPGVQGRWRYTLA